ncbi:hypothetical protein Taro_009291 [Colocasia esculenta]|uniref:Uncharacterized protein n=1 Tax=Colocasia esculenta TaxID=4460 RepID=A0A843U595_COLES|nr:hypothetical protein [Colocasia esculenta]
MLGARTDVSRQKATAEYVAFRNTVNVTVKLSSFGRPKEEKLKSHLRPLREAATTTWSKHSLGHSQPSQPGSQRGQPTTHHRQRETSDVREPPEDTHSRHGDTAAAKRIVHSPYLLPGEGDQEISHPSSSGGSAPPAV